MAGLKQAPCLGWEVASAWQIMRINKDVRVLLVDHVANKNLDRKVIFNAVQWLKIVGIFAPKSKNSDSGKRTRRFSMKDAKIAVSVSEIENKCTRDSNNGVCERINHLGEYLYVT